MMWHLYASVHFVAILWHIRGLSMALNPTKVAAASSIVMSFKLCLPSATWHSKLSHPRISKPLSLRCSYVVVAEYTQMLMIYIFIERHWLGIVPLRQIGMHSDVSKVPVGSDKAGCWRNVKKLYHAVAMLTFLQETRLLALLRGELVLPWTGALATSKAIWDADRPIKRTKW